VTGRQIGRERAAWLAFLALASAWIAAVAGLATLPVAASAVALARTGSASPRAALLLAWLAGMTALAALAYAGLCAFVAHGLRRERPWARAGAFALAGVNLLLPPLGTAHGVYTLWLLLRTSGSADDIAEGIDDHH
jgi:hypothetical protein